MKQGLIVYLVGSEPLPEPFDLKDAGRSLGHPADRVELVSRDAGFFSVEDAWHFLATQGGCGRIDLVVGITVPITTLCPCSKEISQVGAHNQRGEVRVQVRFKRFFWIEDLIRQVEESASCEVYALLKRQDEKFVTERAYKNPMFVEDVVREIAHKLRKDQNFTWFAVESENFESIHNHSAYAYIESK